jgi:hypothetical protein
MLGRMDDATFAGDICLWYRQGYLSFFQYQDLVSLRLLETSESTKAVDTTTTETFFCSIDIFQVLVSTDSISICLHCPGEDGVVRRLIIGMEELDCVRSKVAEDRARAKCCRPSGHHRRVAERHPRSMYPRSVLRITSSNTYIFTPVAIRKTCRQRCPNPADHTTSQEQAVPIARSGGSNVARRNLNAVAASNAPSRVSTWHAEISAAYRLRCRTMVALAGPVPKSLHSL